MKRTFIIVILAIVLSLAAIWVVVYLITPHPVPTPEPLYVLVDSERFHANNYQHSKSSDTYLSVYNNQLYRCTIGPAGSLWDTAVESELSVFSGGKLQPVTKLEGEYLGTSNGFVYYSEHISYDTEHVYCYSIAEDEHTKLTTVEGFSFKKAYFTESGSFLVPVDRDGERYYEYVGKTLAATHEEPFALQLKDRQYSTRDYDNSELVCIQNGQEQSLNDVIPSGDKSLIPCEGGLLVHNEGQDGLLYFIDEESGAVRELFYVQCMESDSAVNTYGNYAFLSFTRWEKWGDFGMLRFENDTLEGTYRIDICTGETVKISDTIYACLYIFGDNAIYAVDTKDQIYLLDFDGNVQQEILLNN